jgi:hypothetical protein
MIYQVISDIYIYIYNRWIRIPFLGPNRGVKADVFGMGLLILMTLEDLLIAFLAFFLGVGLAVAFHLLA